MQSLPGAGLHGFIGRMAARQLQIFLLYNALLRQFSATGNSDIGKPGVAAGSNLVDGHAVEYERISL